MFASAWRQYNHGNYESQKFVLVIMNLIGFDSFKLKNEKQTQPISQKDFTTFYAANVALLELSMFSSLSFFYIGMQRPFRIYTLDYTETFPQCDRKCMHNRSQ